MLRNMAMAAACVVLACGSEAHAASRPALMASPQPNAAMVSSMPGLVNGEKAMTIAGKEKTIWDGIVLRATRIKADGTLVIPPAGAYTTARSGNWRPFDNEPVRLAGKTFYYINQHSVRDVVHDVVMVPGQIVPMNPEKSRGWELASIATDTFFLPGTYSATFKLVKTTGNYYGTAFPVMTGPNISENANSGKFVKGYYEKAGRTKPGADDPLDMFAIGNNMATSGRSYVIVDEITPEQVKVRELGSDSCSDAWISPTAPTIASYAKGDTFTIGKARVKVTDLGADSVTVAVSEDGKTVTKTFGPWNEATQNKMFLSEATRDQFWTLSPSGKEIVHLNVNNPEGPFAGGKASLVAYQDVIDVQDGSDWPFDDRFRVRPETWATCTFIHEIILENKDEIVLDKTNNVFVGPHEYFKVVLDDYDGKAVNAWHMEDKTGFKTGNLAARSQGQHIDVVVGADCRSTAHFFSRVYPALYREALAAQQGQ